MKCKLWTALFAALAMTTLLSTAAAAEDWGTGAWEVAKRQTDWTPDGVWKEGEYYSVSEEAYQTVNRYAANEELYEWGTCGDYWIGMSWDEEYLYTFISYAEPDGYVVTSDLWDGTAIQFSGTDAGQVTTDTSDPRLEIGLTMDWNGDISEPGSKISTNWCDWLNSGYGFDNNCTDDFEMFYCDGLVTIEFRVPFSAFSEITPAVDAQVGVAYVICTGNGEGMYAHTQIGDGITGDGKHAEEHALITLTAAPDISVTFPEEVYRYGILFHNIGNQDVRSNYETFYLDAENGYQNPDEGTSMAEDLMGILAGNTEKLKELTNVEGYHIVGFRPVYWNRVDDIFTVAENLFYTLEDTVSLKDEELMQYAWYDDEDTWCIMFTACYDPDMYTVKFNNVGNVNPDDYWTAQKVIDVPYGINLMDIAPTAEEYPELDSVTGYEWLNEWYVLDYTNTEGQYASDLSVNLYKGEEQRYRGLDSQYTAYAREPENAEDGNYPIITFRAEYMPIDYKINFWDDDGVTHLSTETLHIGDSIRAAFPEMPEKDYGTFSQWRLDRTDGEGSLYMSYEDENNPTYTLDANLIGMVAYDTNENGVGDTIDLYAEYTLNEDAGELRANGIIETENGDIVWEVFWNGLLYVGSHAEGAEGLVIPDYNADTNTYAPWHAYRNYITELEIGSEIGVIGDFAFAELQKVEYLLIPGNVKAIGTCAFGDCWGVTRIDLEYGIETIGWDAFCGCNTDDLWIPATVTEMSRASFAHLGTHWYGVDEYNPVFYAEDGVLFGQTGEDLVLWAYPKWREQSTYAVPDGVDIIGSHAFKWVENLMNVVLPDSLVSIEHSAFSRSGVTSVHIPAGVVNVEDWAFEGTNSLSSVYFYGPVPTDYVGYDVFTENTEDFTIYYLEGQDGWTEGEWDNPHTEDVEEAYPTAVFSAEANLAEGSIDGTDITWYITMDGKLYVNGSGEIPDDIWNYGNSWHNHLNDIREIHIGDDFTRIGNHAFDGVSYVTALTLPKNLKEVGCYAFGGGYNSVGTLVLPGYLEKLDYGAFWDMGITKVTIPAATDLIIGNVFAGCPVTEYVVESGNPMYLTDEYGVLYCKESEDSNKVVELTAYPMASELTEYTVPAGEVEIGGTVYDFAIDSLDDRAVHCTWNLEKITLPDTLTIIKEHSLSYNGGLRELTIPASVNELYPGAMCENGQLDSITFHGDKPSMHAEENGTQFENNAEGFTIYYYEGTEGWADYDLYPTAALRRTAKGDVTGDGIVTASDLSLLTQYFAGYPTDVDLSAADIDGENGLTRKDVMILKRYIAGWEGYDQYFAE